MLRLKIENLSIEVEGDEEPPSPMMEMITNLGDILKMGRPMPVKEAKGERSPACSFPPGSPAAAGIDPAAITEAMRRAIGDPDMVALTDLSIRYLTDKISKAEFVGEAVFRDMVAAGLHGVIQLTDPKTSATFKRSRGA